MDNNKTLPKTASLISRTNWSLVAMCIGAGIIASMQLNKVIPAIPLLRQSLKLSMVEAGWVMSIFSLTTIFLGFFSGVLGDRFGSRRMIAAGLLCLITGCFLGLSAGDSHLLLISRIVEGFGFTLVLVSAPALIAKSTAFTKRKFALGLWAIYMPTGTVLILLLAPAILNLGSWPALWVFSGLINVAALIIFLLITRRYRCVTSHQGVFKKSETPDIISTISRPGPWLLALVMGLFTMQNNTLWTWAPSYFMENHSLPMTKAILATIMLPLLNIVGNILGGLLLHRGVAGWLLLSFASLCMFVFTLGMFDPQLSNGLRLSLLVLHALIGPLIPSSIFALVPLCAPSQKHLASANGLIISGANLGIFLGPPVVAAVVTHFGDWYYASLVLCGCATVGFLLSVGLRGIERQSRN